VRFADAFDGAEFLGLARRARRDPYRLELFARHLDPDEEATAILPVAGGTLVVTDRRLLHLTSHLEVDGAWNVREFQGYAISREFRLQDIEAVERVLQKKRGGVEDVLRITAAGGTEDVVLSAGPEQVLSDEDASRLESLLTRRSPSRGSSSGASPGRARSPG